MTSCTRRRTTRSTSCRSGTGFAHRPGGGPTSREVRTVDPTPFEPSQGSGVFHPDVEHRVQTLLGIGRLGDLARPAVPIICRGLEDESPLVRQTAAAILAEFDGLEDSAVKALADALADEDAVVRRRVATTLGLLGAGAAAAVPALTAALRDPDESVRYSAVAALGEIGPAARSAVPELQSALDAPDGRTHAIVTVALRRI